METVTYFHRTRSDLGYEFSLWEGNWLFNFHMSDELTYLCICGVRFICRH
jgi:hypothetical protein